jgi:hypothetical protein
VSIERERDRAELHEVMGRLSRRLAVERHEAKRFQGRIARGTNRGCAVLDIIDRGEGLILSGTQSGDKRVADRDAPAAASVPRPATG